MHQDHHVSHQSHATRTQNEDPTFDPSNAFRDRIADMSAVKGRSKRPPGAATVPLQGRVPENVRDAARVAADAAGISISAYLEALVLADAEQHFVRPAQEYRQEAIPA